MSNKRLNRIICIGSAIIGLYMLMNSIVKKADKNLHIDDDNQYINYDKADDVAFKHKEGKYLSYVKPFIDKVLSFCGLVIIGPIYGAIALAIKIDDPGAVFFTQKRVGKNGHYFMLHKFRSMKMSTPHDVPTHMLKDPEKYMTKVGRILRKTSLDELPQIWDIFRGKMSIIGPRPALWNQSDLVAEREKYGANSVLPGLTGLAQIKGRDKLDILDKAKIDGEYTRILKNGGFLAFSQDVACFVGTIGSVLRHDGVVEGGTGSLQDLSNNFLEKKTVGMQSNSLEDVGFEDYGYKKKFYIDANVKKDILITGADSYIGESFKIYVEGNYPNLSVDTLDMRGEEWKAYDFSQYDAVFHVAGIAHAEVENVSEEVKQQYYAVNTDLAIATARKAREDGVKQFILMSSMIIYGEANFIGKQQIIDETTIPAPTNFYGDSKWQADVGVRKLANEKFRVAVLRAPMIYGRGSKGNYQKLSKLAKLIPVFPDVENRRSMLYIDNLSEFVAQLLFSGYGGIYFPQNSSYTKTADMVKLIGEESHQSISTLKILSPIVRIGAYIPGKIGHLTRKVFGNSIYDKKISEYDGLEYQLVSLTESIKRTEETKNKVVLMLVNHDVVIYNFRLELVERLLKDGYEVHISSPYGERINELIILGAVYHEIIIDRHGMNPKEELHILKNYKKLMKELRPVIVFGYTIKPNIYGAMAARDAHIPFVANITGLGSAVENDDIKQRMIIILYKIAFIDIQRVFFQNIENERFFTKYRIAKGKHVLLPGSGVNLKRYPFSELPGCGNGISGSPIKFAFISRIMKEKGIEQYLEAAKAIKKRYPATEFHVCGFCESEYDGRLEELNRSCIISYHGMIRDVSNFMKNMHCIVHPTYYPEGLSNVLLEASACGRPIITTNRAGCREIVKNNGFLISERNIVELIEAIESFINLTYSDKAAMGKAGRILVEEKYSRDIVVDAYMNEIK